MWQNQIHCRYLLVFILPAFGIAGDYFPLAKGCRWHYSFVQPNSATKNYTVKIASDTTIGQRHYYQRQWIATDTSKRWLFVSGNDVFSLNDLSKPDSAKKIGQKTFTTGDHWNDGIGMLGNVHLVVSFNGRDSVSAGAYDSTWSAGWTDADTIAGGLVMVRSAINHVFANGVGEIRQTVIAYGTTAHLKLDSFYIAPGAAIRDVRKPQKGIVDKQAKLLPVLASKDRPGNLFARLYCLNGRMFPPADIRQAPQRSHLPVGMMIAFPVERDGEKVKK